MIPVDKTIQIRGNLTQGKTFEIIKNSMAFSLMMDKLYVDRKGAVIRELSCNARDIHTSIGKPAMPFCVGLPTVIDPNLVIRDFGTGLSDDDVFDFICTIFSSSKRETDDEIGCMGLGAKSPYALTDTFTLHSIHQGIETIFLCSRNSDGEPCLMQISKMESDKTSGLQYVIPVDMSNSKAAAQFEHCLRRQLFMFEVRPIVLCGRDACLDHPDSECDDVFDWQNVRHDEFLTTDYGIVLKSANGFTPDQFTVSMGGVMYPVDVTLINQTTTGNLVKWAIRSQHQHHIICVPIGSVDFHPSRESLSYDKKTAAFVKEMFIKHFDQMDQIIHSVTNGEQHTIKTYSETVKAIRSVENKLLKEICWESDVEIDLSEIGMDFVEGSFRHVLNGMKFPNPFSVDCISKIDDEEFTIGSEGVNYTTRATMLSQLEMAGVIHGYNDTPKYMFQRIYHSCGVWKVSQAKYNGLSGIQKDIAVNKLVRLVLRESSSIKTKGINQMMAGVKGVVQDFLLVTINRDWEQKGLPTDFDDIIMLNSLFPNGECVILQPESPVEKAKAEFSVDGMSIIRAGKRWIEPLKRIEDIKGNCFYVEANAGDIYVDGKNIGDWNVLHNTYMHGIDTDVLVVRRAGLKYIPMLHQIGIRPLESMLRDVLNNTDVRDDFLNDYRDRIVDATLVCLPRCLAHGMVRYELCGPEMAEEIKRRLLGYQVVDSDGAYVQYSNRRVPEVASGCPRGLAEVVATDAAIHGILSDTKLVKTLNDIKAKTDALLEVFRMPIRMFASTIIASRLHVYEALDILKDLKRLKELEADQH